MDEVRLWMAIHPIRVDIAILLLVAGTIVYLLRHQRRLRRIAHRKVWAMKLKRKDLERLHLMRFEDAITDACFEMKATGEMSDSMEKEWYRFFAEQYGMKGLIPGGHPSQPAIKRGIRTRLSFWWGKPKPVIPGGMPEVKVDETYKPAEEVTMKSKYVR